MGAAWLLCLIGWTGVLLSPGQQISAGVTPASADALEAEREQPLRNRSAGGLPASRARAASLQSDLAAALALHDVLARRLAGLPRALEDGRHNPLYRRAALHLAQQAALIAALQSQLVAELAEIFELEQADSRTPDVRRPPADAAPDPAESPVDPAPVDPSPVALPDALPPPALAAPDPAIEDAGHRSALSAVLGPPPLDVEASGTAALLGVFAVAIAAGLTLAVWRGLMDRIVQDAPQLQRRFRPPLLGTVSILPSPEEQRRARLAGIHFGLGALALLALCAGVATVEALDLLANDRPGGARLAGMIIGFHYSRSPTRRGARPSPPERMTRRLSSGEGEVGAWRGAPESAPPLPTPTWLRRPTRARPRPISRRLPPKSASSRRAISSGRPAGRS